LQDADKAASCKPAFYFHILTTMHGQNHIKFKFN